MNQITITFCSKPDQEEFARQFHKAQEYAGKGRQLGQLGLAIMLKTIERAKTIETGNPGLNALAEAARNTVELYKPITTTKKKL